MFKTVKDVPFLDLGKIILGIVIDIFRYSKFLPKFGNQSFHTHVGA